eukprot:9486283-Pyramimonas_sp.AAC.1
MDAPKLRIRLGPVGQTKQSRRNSLPRLCLESSYSVCLKGPGSGLRPGRFPQDPPRRSPSCAPWLKAHDPEVKLCSPVYGVNDSLCRRPSAPE